MSKDETVVLGDRLGDHPAVRAWRQVESGPGPASIEVLKPERSEEPPSSG
jgi:hypothetical protein